VPLIAADKLDLPVFKSFCSDQDVPLYNSTFDPPPPAAKLAVLSTPKPIKLFLAVFKSLTSVQDVPFQDSVIATVPGSKSPPKANPAVVDPAPASKYLAVFKSLTSVHDVPF